MGWIQMIFVFVRSLLRSQAELAAENLVLRHHRRMVGHFNVTAHPTARWTAQQIVEAFSYDETPRSLIRDRDGIYGVDFRQRIKHMGIEEVVTAP